MYLYIKIYIIYIYIVWCLLIYHFQYVSIMFKKPHTHSWEKSASHLFGVLAFSRPGATVPSSSLKMLSTSAGQLDSWRNDLWAVFKWKEKKNKKTWCTYLFWYHLFLGGGPKSWKKTSKDPPQLIDVLIISRLALAPDVCRRLHIQIAGVLSTPCRQDLLGQ